MVLVHAGYFLLEIGGKSSVVSIVSTLCILTLVVTGHTVFAANFGNALMHAWATTPHGKFECREDESTGNRQVLTLGGRVVYQQPPNESVQGGATLVQGIRNENVGCPSIVASQAGYVVIVRDTQPPSYGIQGYAVINFNNMPPTVTELAEGQRPGDEKSGTKIGSLGTRPVWCCATTGIPWRSLGGPYTLPSQRPIAFGSTFRLKQSRKSNDDFSQPAAADAFQRPLVPRSCFRRRRGS